MDLDEYPFNPARHHGDVVLVYRAVHELDTDMIGPGSQISDLHG